MRRGFTLLSAIFLMVLVATLMMLAYSLSSQTKKQTGDIYMQEQAQLLARSATEFALLAISGHDNRNDCIERINLQYPQGSPIYDINMSLYYIGNGLVQHRPHTRQRDRDTGVERNGTDRYRHLLYRSGDGRTGTVSPAYHPEAIEIRLRVGWL